MLSYQALRRRQPVQLVLIHGLFSNGAFWIPYLQQLGNFQVTLLSVDYGAILGGGASLDAVAAQVDRIVGEKPAHLIGHSFGSWLAMHLKAPSLSRSFICPTFAAHDFQESAFRAEMAVRTALGGDDIAALVECAINYKQDHAANLHFLPADHFYLPGDDPYFRYKDRMEKGHTHLVRGGHFDVGPAMSMIAEMLSLGERQGKP